MMEIHVCFVYLDIIVVLKQETAPCQCCICIIAFFICYTISRKLNSRRGESRFWVYLIPGYIAIHIDVCQ